MPSRVLSYNGAESGSSHVATVWFQSYDIASITKDRKGKMWVSYYDGDGRKNPRPQETYCFENISYSRYYYFTRTAQSMGSYSYWQLGTPYNTTGYRSAPPNG